MAEEWKASAHRHPQGQPADAATGGETGLPVLRNRLHGGWFREDRFPEERNMTIVRAYKKGLVRTSPFLLA